MLHHVPTETQKVPDADERLTGVAESDSLEPAIP